MVMLLCACKFNTAKIECIHFESSRRKCLNRNNEFLAGKKFTIQLRISMDPFYINPHNNDSEVMLYPMLFDKFNLRS